MANPRYYQPQPRISSRDERLGQLAQLVALQRSLSGSDTEQQQSRMNAVLQLMNVMERQRSGQDTHAIALEQVAGAKEGRQLTREQMAQSASQFDQSHAAQREQFTQGQGLQRELSAADLGYRKEALGAQGAQHGAELAQRAELAREENAIRQTGLSQDMEKFRRGQDQQGGQFEVDALLRRMAMAQQEKQASAELAQRGDISNKQLGALMFNNAGQVPSGNLVSSLHIGGIHDPALAQAANDMSAQQRQAAINSVYPELKLITDPKAREVHGQAQLKQYPGAFDEAMKLAYPTGTQSTQVAPANGPLDTFILNLLTVPKPPPGIPKPPEQTPLEWLLENDRSMELPGERRRRLLREKQARQ